MKELLLVWKSSREWLLKEYSGLISELISQEKAKEETARRHLSGEQYCQRVAG